jgi:CDP-Glycerol:Poly(glycerophosphate) glycerophosphotransferase
VIDPIGSVRRELRRRAAWVIRRLGAVPEGQPDGLGEDDSLAGTAFTETVLMIYPDAPSNLYQLRHWLATLEALHPRLPTAILVQDSRVASQIRRETALQVYCVAAYRTFETLTDRGAVRLALYAAHHTRNFQIMRRADLCHVYLGHGESDKAVSASNQLKAYDFTFVAGQAAIDRASVLPFYDASARAVVVGRPQLRDLVRGSRPAAARTTVLYAPTWEGGQESMSYSSLTWLGPQLVTGLIDGGFQVLYRPHPRTGISDLGHAAADAAVRKLIHNADVEHPNAGHRVTGRADVVQDFNSADLLVTDVSALVIDWLPTGRPVIVTKPSSVEEQPTPALKDLPGLSNDDDPLAVVRRVLEDGVDLPAREALAAYYVAEVGDPYVAFATACDEVLQRHAAARTGAIGRT